METKAQYPFVFGRDRKLLAKVLAAANVILVLAGVVCLLALSYFVYHYGWTGQRQFSSAVGLAMYYGFPAGLAILLFAAARLKAAYRIILAISCLLLAASAYGVEVFLHLSDSTLSLQQIMAMPAQKRKKMAAKLATQFGVDIDARDRHEVIFDLRKEGIDAVPLVWKSAVDIDVVPLGGIANKLTVVCNQNGKYLIYESDEHGFHNPRGMLQPGHVDIAAVGNSLTLGYCVPADRNFVGLIRGRYPATQNLGMTGEGPLRILAILKEYARLLKPRLVLWFYSEGSTFSELRSEQQSPTLMRYLGDEFTQHLIARQSDIDQALTGDMDRQIAVERSRLAESQAKSLGNSGKLVGKLSGLIRLGALRQKLGLVYGTRTQEWDEPSELEGDMNLFRDILSKAKARVSAWGGNLQFVYLPSWSRFAEESPVEVGVKSRMRILTILRTLGIPLIDICPAFSGHGDPLSLFPFRRPGHYNDDGHRVVAETVLSYISRPQPRDSSPRPSGNGEMQRAGKCSS